MKDKELNTLVVERDMPKTRELFNRVMKSLKTHSFSEKLPEIMTIHTEDMIDIARYILPTVTVGKSDLSWVSVPARNSIKDGYRQASMKVVYVEPSRMWSTIVNFSSGSIPDRLNMFSFNRAAFGSARTED